MFLERIKPFLTQPYVMVVLAGVAAYWISTRTYPVIILLARKKTLRDIPGELSGQDYQVPFKGGVGIFFVFSVLAMSLTFLVNCPPEELSRTLSLMAALCILFFLGVKEDMTGMDPIKKIMVQLLAASIVIFISGTRIQSLEGIFGIGELPYSVSVAFTFLMFLLIVHAFNLIDGIEGLASTIALIATIVFGGFFLVSGYIAMAVTSFILVGALLGFLRYNFFNAKSLLLGNSGSLFLGFLLAYQGIWLINFNQDAGAILSNAPVIVLSVLSFPLLDALRVFILRASRRRSPFSADRNHLHHRLLDKGSDHKQATALIALKTLLILTVCWVLQDIPINLHFFVMSVLSLLVFFGLNNLKLISPKNFLNDFHDVSHESSEDES